jgi:hypothetical protein
MKVRSLKELEEDWSLMDVEIAHELLDELEYAETKASKPKT